LLFVLILKSPFRQWCSLEMNDTSKRGEQT
jgi:hypothetical protein